MYVTIGSYKMLEAETTAEIFGVSCIENSRILRKWFASSLRRGGNVLRSKKLSGNIHVQGEISN